MTDNDTYNKELTLEEWKEMKQAEKNALYNEINETALSIVNNPEKFQTYLNIQSRNNRYSAKNCLILLKHCPNASKLRTFDDWIADNLPNKPNNVYLKKNQKAIPILEPYDYIRKDGTKGIGYNIKKVFDVSQTTAKQTPAPTLNDNPLNIVKALINSAPINVEVADELPDPKMGAFYNNDKQTLFIQRNVRDNVTLCRCLTRELGCAELSVQSDIYSRRDIEFQAVCIGYMLCRKYGVYAKNLGIDRIPENWKNMESKEIRSKLSETRSAMKEINDRLAIALYRQNKEITQEKSNFPKRESNQEQAR